MLEFQFFPDNIDSLLYKVHSITLALGRIYTLTFYYMNMLRNAIAQHITVPFNHMHTDAQQNDVIAIEVYKSTRVFEVLPIVLS